MPKKIKELELLPLFHKFINELKKGKILQKNGKRIKKSSIKNYEYLEQLLIKFSANRKYKIRMMNLDRSSKSQHAQEKKYWKDFYFEFTSFLYNEMNHFDNYVGRMIKLLRSFFNHLTNEKGLNIGQYYKSFYAPSEEIDIIAISPERIKILMNNKELEKRLSKDLQEVKDVFIIGCFVALRFSDLMALKKANIEKLDNNYYLKVKSKKTQTLTNVKLPQYAINLINKYNRRYTERLFPEFSKVYFNKKIKEIMEFYGFTEEIQRTRQKQGVPVMIYKNKTKKSHYRFCDAVSSHSMRRSAITSMLSLGMNEQVVRQISGHSANSKDFYRYIAFAQTYLDKQIDQVHENLQLTAEN